LGEAIGLDIEAADGLDCLGGNALLFTVMLYLCFFLKLFVKSSSISCKG